MNLNKKIFYLQYTNPAFYPPLENSSTLFSDKGWEVKFFGVKRMLLNNTDPEPKIYPNIEYIYVQAAMGKLWKKLHYIFFLCRSFYLVLIWRPSVIYCSDTFSTCVGYFLKKVFNMKAIYHEHDSPEWDRKRSNIFLKIFWIKFAQNADLCVLPNQLRCNHFLKETKTEKPVMRVWNCPLSKDIQKLTPKESITRPFSLIYAGGVSPERLPITVLDALEKIKQDLVLKIVGYDFIDSDYYLSKFLGEAKRRGVSDKVYYVGLANHYQLYEIIRNSDIGLGVIPMNHSNINFRGMFGASNKIFEYLACGLPVLVSDISEWVEMIVKPGYGLSCDPKIGSSVEEKLSWFISHPEEMKSMGRRGRDRVLKEWNYESEFTKVFEMLDSNR